jgi:hypothetical protein
MTQPEGLGQLAAIPPDPCVSALQADRMLGTLTPWALPWAALFGPFGALERAAGYTIIKRSFLIHGLEDIPIARLEVAGAVIEHLELV